MHAVVSHPIDRFASARSGHSHLFAEQLIDQLADDFVTLNAEGGATLDALLALGWEKAFIEANQAEARRRANGRFLRPVEAEPVKTLAEIEGDIAGIIASQLPPAQLLIAECQARGISKHHLDLLFHKARARAALGFANGQSQGAH